MTALLVASTGGHLRQLHELRSRIAGTQDAVWFTFDTPQSRSLLADEEVVFGTYAGPRAVAASIANVRAARRLLSRRRFELAVSTGASVAVAVLPLARARGISCHYIESATRVAGPSLSGRMLRQVPGIHLYSQYPSWATGPWTYSGSIFDGFRAIEERPRPPRRVLVTLGTIGGYGFRALLERMLALLPDDVEVVWQVGTTDATGLPIDGRPEIPSREFDQLLGDVDVVVSHAGTGSAIAAMRAGKLPVLVPRRAARGEHVDDHQTQIAEELARRGLALHRELDVLDLDDLNRAAGCHVELRSSVDPFVLSGVR